MYKLKIKEREDLQARIEENYEVWFEFAKQTEYDALAAEIREKRNRLLQESDAEMCIDRLGLEVPEGSTFTAWLSFLRSIGNILIGSMARYRQELRDITKQEGFPYNVEFPKKPKTKEEE